jgi:hypothetical protein
VSGGCGVLEPGGELVPGGRAERQDGARAVLGVETGDSDHWRKSSYSGNGGADCVEVGAATVGPQVLVREIACRPIRAATSLPIASSLVSSWPARNSALAYSGVCRRPGMMIGCHIRSVVASCSALSQSSNHDGKGADQPLHSR